MNSISSRKLRRMFARGVVDFHPMFGLRITPVSKHNHARSLRAAHKAGTVCHSAPLVRIAV